MATTKHSKTGAIWAADAAASAVVDPDVTAPGKFGAGWGAEIPPYEWFNFIQQLVTQQLAYINEQGIGEWDSATVYPVNAVVKGSTGAIYTAVIENTNNDPVVDGGTNWAPLTAVAQIEQMTRAERKAIVSPAAGRIVFDTDWETEFRYDGSAWRMAPVSKVFEFANTGSGAPAVLTETLGNYIEIHTGAYFIPALIGSNLELKLVSGAASKTFLGQSVRIVGSSSGDTFTVNFYSSTISNASAVSFADPVIDSTMPHGRVTEIKGFIDNIHLDISIAPSARVVVNVSGED